MEAAHAPRRTGDRPLSAPSNLGAEWARLLVDALAAAGVSDVVLSPGSRSTPFVLAVAAHPGLRCHDVVDERSAGFYALGLSRVTSAPPLLLCTSGTAAAHYLPSVIEAGAARVPLLVLTADRPFELMGCAAPQTIDQVRLFGEHARDFVELGLPNEAPGALRALRRQAAQAVLTARWPLPGAVHLNARVQKPLEPPTVLEDAERDLAALVRSIGERAPTRAFPPRELPSEEGLAELARACLGAKRGLLVAGPAPLSAIGARADLLALAALTGFPLLVEAPSQLRFCDDGGALRVDAFDTLLRSPRFREQAAPDLIVQIGAPPTSSAWERYLDAHSGCPRFVVAARGWNDPRSDAEGLLYGEVRETARALLARLRERPPAPSGAWRQRFEDGNAAAWRAVDRVLAARSLDGRRADGAPALSEGEAVRMAVGSVPKAGLLAIGNSLPIREVDTWCPSSAAECAVWSQRGANGIDGLISGAAGAAASGRPVTLLIGDVSFLHDLGGLAVAARAKAPLVIVVLDNGGGRIFEQLPVARVPGVALEHWTTPGRLSIGHAASAFGIAHLRAETRGALHEALEGAQAATGCTVVEVPLAPHGAAEMAAALDAAMGAWT